jgi:hypothetical protein
MLDHDAISVPCPCGAQLFFRHRACPSCGAPVSPALREALEARLESSHAEYREARDDVRRASTLLLVLGLLHLAMAGLLWLIASSYDRAGVVANGLIGVALLGCQRAARRAPVAATAAGLSTFVLVRLALFLLAPAEILLSFLSLVGILTTMAKIAVLFVLARGVLSALRFRRIEAQLSVGG